MSGIAISRPGHAAAATVRGRRALGIALVWAVVLGNAAAIVFLWVHGGNLHDKPESEISRIRTGELEPGGASEEAQSVLALCEELRQETGGYFDARRCSPEGLDPSGVVKGWAVDGAAAILDRASLRDYAVNAGGDIRTRGRWQIGIQHPTERAAVAKVVDASDIAIATSGPLLRGADDPRRRPRARDAGLPRVRVAGSGASSFRCRRSVGGCS